LCSIKVFLQKPHVTQCASGWKASFTCLEKSVIMPYMIRKSSKHALVGGVCAGYAISEKVPLALVRLVVLLVILATGVFIGGIAYLAAWILMPGAETGPVGWDHLEENNQFYRDSSNKVIAGVCGAFARYFKADPTLVRVIFILLLLVGGVGLLTYLVAWVAIPLKNQSTAVEV
jgi:phage shock protein PspC (stress-responsive transcriptional regulator)